MARSIHRLKALQLKNAPSPSKLCDGGGLWLYVSDTGSRNWVFRYRLRGTDQEMGLGPLYDVALSVARERAATYRALKRDGINPIEHREKERAEARLEASNSMVFRDCVTAYLTAHESTWKNAKHRQQWKNTLEDYASSVFGDLPVQKIDTALVAKALEAIWYEKTETASRVRQRIEAVLDWATVREYRQGENPARWRGHLDKILPKRTKIQQVKHHSALPYSGIGGFLAALRQQEGTAARALEFTILTAARTSEVLGAKWAEIDLDARTWTIPAERMKAKREHRVPLSDQALALLETLPRVGVYVFPGMRRGKPLSNMAMLQTLKRMERTDLTVHGFRSTFRDWCAESTNFSREVAESALAHVLTNKVEAAYQRGDLLAKRAKLMQVWADYCSMTGSAEVTPIRKTG